MKTTLNRIRLCHPCEESWKTLLTFLNKTEADNEELSIRTILDVCGVSDAIWALRAVEGHDKEIRLFACDCVESVLHIFESEYPNDSRPRIAIETARRYANGQATKQELDAARSASWDAVSDAAWDAAWDAVWYAARSAAMSASWYAVLDAASDASWNAASDAASDDELEKQKEFLLKYI